MSLHAQTTQVQVSKGSEAPKEEHRCLVVFSKAAKKEKAETPSSLFRQDRHTFTFSARNLPCFCVEIESEAAGHLSEISGCLAVWTCAVIWLH